MYFIKNFCIFLALFVLSSLTFAFLLKLRFPFVEVVLIGIISAIIFAWNRSYDQSEQTEQIPK